MTPWPAFRVARRADFDALHVLHFALALAAAPMWLPVGTRPR